MKSAIFVLALLTSAAAIAQGDMAKVEPANAPIMAAPASGQTVAPSNADPEHDARGIAVISDPAAVPTGFNGTTHEVSGVGGPLVDPADTADMASAKTTADASYPACSRSVTDNCVQTYERSRTR